MHDDSAWLAGGWRSVAARAALAHARGRRRGRAQPQVVERAVQLTADLVEQFLAGDQIVCGHRRGRSVATAPCRRAIQTHACRPADGTLGRRERGQEFHQL